jgi:hypothetical protein
MFRGGLRRERWPSMRSLVRLALRPARTVAVSLLVALDDDPFAGVVDEDDLEPDRGDAALAAAAARRAELRVASVAA